MSGPAAAYQPIILPWPPAEMSPNARLHWRKLHKAKSAYKDLCAWALMPQPRPVAPETGRIPIAITICPPDHRRRDRDNMQSSLKYALDSLATRMGVDDSRFDPSYSFAEPVKGGKVVVVVGGGA